MLAALYFKEWRDKALVFAFELGVLVLLLAAPVVLRAKMDVREWLVYAVLLLFFPFAALILGASGFEAEYRQGAWAYLFSRPVSRPAIWLAKFGALLSMFAALWLVFLIAWAAVPAVRQITAGPRVLLTPLVPLAWSGFPWWSLGQSLFLLTVAFSLSLLHERHFSILAVALVLGLLSPAAAWSLIISKTGGFMAWLAPAKAFRTLLVSQVLIALAFAGASLRTLVRSDFSQPRKQLRTFVGSFTVLVVLAAAGTVGSALLIPVPAERKLDLLGSSDGKAVYATERGLFSYDSASGRVCWLTRRRNVVYWFSSIANGRLVYTVLNFESRRDATWEIWLSNTDGSGRKRLVGRGTPGAWPSDHSIRGLTISPGGRTIAILTENVSRRQKGRAWATMTLWTVNDDGSGLEKRSLEALFPGGPEENLWLSFVAWAREGKVLIILKRHSLRPVFWSLWAYDLELRTSSKIRDDAVPVGSGPMQNPRRRDILAILSGYSGEGSRTMSLLDLATWKETEIAREERPAPINVQWGPAGDRMSFFVKKLDAEGRASYVLTVYSLTAGMVVAERALTDRERMADMYSTAWMPDGHSILALDAEGRRLRVLGPDLQDAGLIDLPARVKEPSRLVIVGGEVILQDRSTRSLWRFSLEKKRWARIY
jgi:ABC-2 family transporter protein